MERPLPPFLSTVVFLRVLFYLQLYSYFSLTTFLTVLLTLFTLMLMTQLYILLLISNLLPLLRLELLLVFNFPILSCRSGWNFPVGSWQPCEIQLFKNSTSSHLPLKNTSQLSYPLRWLSRLTCK